MIKPLEILEIKPFELLIKFSNNEIKILDVEHTIDRNIKNVELEKLFDKEIFRTVKIGELGQLYWENIAKMKTDNGFINCEYDMSPEFVYFQSKKRD